MVVFERCLEELYLSMPRGAAATQPCQIRNALYAKARLGRTVFERTPMARHGLSLDGDEVRYFTRVKKSYLLGEHFYRSGMFKPPLKSPKKHYVYLGLTKSK